jgi:hypothetical protein
MTSQTKKFIELSDIIALRFECKNQKCKSTLTTSVRDFRQGTLNACPVCKNPWATVNGGSCELAISDFMQAFHKMEKMLGSGGEFPAGFSITLEVKEEPKLLGSQRSEPGP